MPLPPLSPSDHGVIRNDRVFDAMLATDRGLYSTDHPYADSPQSIGAHFSHTDFTGSLYLATERKRGIIVLKLFNNQRLML